MTIVFIIFHVLCALFCFCFPVFLLRLCLPLSAQLLRLARQVDSFGAAVFTANPDTDKLTKTHTAITKRLGEIIKRKAAEEEKLKKKQAKEEKETKKQQVREI